MKTLFTYRFWVLTGVVWLMLGVGNKAEGAARTASVTGNWNATATWGGAAVPTSIDDITINAGITVTMNVAGSCRVITSMGNGAVINGSSALTLSPTSSITIAANANATISCIIGGAGTSLTLSGSSASNLTLASTNSYSGETILSGGNISLYISNTSALGTNRNVTIPVNTGLYLSTSNQFGNYDLINFSGTLGNASSSSPVWNGSITTTLTPMLASNSGTFTIAGPIIIGASSRPALAGGGTGIITGNITESNSAYPGSLYKTGSGTWTLQCSNSTTAGVLLGKGQLNINSATALGTGTLSIQTNNGNIIDNTSGGPITLSTNNAHIWANDFTFLGTYNLNIGNGAVQISSSRQITVNGGMLTIEGVISDGSPSAGYGLTKAGAGTLVLSGANTYTGSTTVSGGILRATNNTVVASTNGPFGNNASGLYLDGGTIQTNVSTFSRPITLIDTNSGLDAYGSARTISSTISHDGTASAFNLNVGGTTATGAEGQDLTLSGVITNSTGTIAVTKVGSSTVVMNAVNTYTGGSTLTSGTLKLSNTAGLGATGQTITLNGGTLDLATDASVNGYNTTVGGNVTINSNKSTATSAGITHALGTLGIGAQTLIINKGANVGSGTAAVSFGNFTMTDAPTLNPGTANLLLTGTAAGSYKLTKSGAYTLQKTSTGWTMPSDFEITAGNYDANGQTTTVTGLATVSGGAYLASTALQTFNSGLTISGGTFTGSSGGVTTTNVNLGSGTLTAPSGTFNVSGNWTKSGGTFTPGSNTVTFTNTSGTQTLNSGSSSFNNISHNGAGVLQLNTNALNTSGTYTNTSGAGNFDANNLAHTITGLATITAGSYIAGTATQTFNGGLTINGGTFSGAGGNVTTTDVTLNSGILTAPSGTFNVSGNWAKSGGTFTPGSNTVTFVKSFGTQTLNSGGSSFNNISHNGVGLLQLLTSALTTSGTFSNVTGAGNFDANNLAHTVTGLATITAGSYIAGTAAQTFNGGLTINGGTYTGLSGAAGNTSTTNLTMISGILSSPGSTGTFNISGDWNLTSGFTFTHNNGTVNFNGSGTQEIGGTGITTFNNLTVTNTSAAVSVNTNENIAGTLNMNGSATLLSPTATAVFNNSSATGSITGSGTIQVTRTTVTPDYSSQYKFTTNTLSALTVEYAGSSVQTVSSLTYGALKINNTNGVSLAGATTVNGILTFANGKITTGANILSLGSSATVSGAAADKYVYGTVLYNTTIGAQTKNFPIGDATTYAPVSVAFTTLGTAGSLRATTDSGDHAQIMSSGLNSLKSVNRTWTFSPSAIANYSANITFNWAEADKDGSTSYANYKVAKYDGSSWGLPTVSSPLTTSIIAQSISSFSDFQVGEAWATVNGDYFKSRVTGNWSTSGTWLSSPDDTNWGLASAAPTNSATRITVQNSHIVTVDATSTASTLVIDGTLTGATNSLSVNGNWTNNGTFNCNSGLVNLNGTTQSISGATTFNNLTLSNSGAKTISPATINGILSLEGTATSTGTTPTYGSAATIQYKGSAAQITGVELPATFSGTGGVKIDNSNGVTLAGGTLKTIASGSNLTIVSGKLTIPYNGQLTVAGTLSNSAASGLILESTASGTASLIHNSASVPATIQRYISGAAEDWHFISSPVAAQNIDENVGSPTSWLPSGTYGNGTGYDLYLWNEPTSCWIYKLNTTSTVNWNTAHPGSNFVAGRGYLYSVKALNPTKSFTGNLNSGSVTYNLASASDTARLKGFNLVGNPYPSSIDWYASVSNEASSGWTRSMLETSGTGKNMWIWNPTANNYGVYNSTDATGTGTLDVTRYIAPMQGFFVRAASAGTLGMTNTVRTHLGAGEWKSSQVYPDIISAVVRSGRDDTFDEVRILFGYPPNQTGAAKLFSTVATAPSLYLNTGNSNFTVRYLTDTIAYPSVPVAFKPGSTGTYTLSFSFDASIFNYVLLEDLQTKVIHDLKRDPLYRFNGSVGDQPNRFVVHFTPEKPQADNELPVRIYNDGQNIVVDLTEVTGETRVAVYDVLGRKRYENNLSGETLHALNFIPGTQLLIIQLQNPQGQLIRKIVCNNTSQ